MIQLIVLAIIGIWLAWGIVNIAWGLGQILLGLASGVIAIILYALAFTLEFVGFIARKLIAAINSLKGHFTSAAKSASVRPSTRSKNSAS